MARPIAISLSPNATKKDVFLATQLLFSPWTWQRGDSVGALEQWFREYFNVSDAVGFNSGRAALLAVLKALGVGEGDEVLLQAFTCVAVPNAVIALGAKPVYVDVSQSLTMDASDLAKKITGKTKAIIFQYTFGIPGDIIKIAKLAKERKLFLIEDCAHGIGIEQQGEKTGAIGDAAIFSFGRDKAFSSVFGGMAITGNEEVGKRLRDFEESLPTASLFWIAQQLIHPIAFSFILPLYDLFSFGKMLLVLFQRLQFLSFPVSKEDKKSENVYFFSKKLPNALAKLALFQLTRLLEYNDHRKNISIFYAKRLKDLGIKTANVPNIPFLRFPIFVEEQDGLLSYFRKRKIYLGTWYSNVIDPKGVDFDRIGYQKGMCTNAARFAKVIVNLPTYPQLSQSDAEKVINTLEVFYGNKRSNR